LTKDNNIFINIKNKVKKKRIYCISLSNHYQKN